MITAEGKIIKGVGGLYFVDTPNGEVECRARGKFRKSGLTPMVGDRVTVAMGTDGTGSIQSILPRKNFLIRPSVANIDALVLVSAAASPSPDLSLLDKMLVIAARKGIEAILCFNKADLAACGEIESLVSTYEKAGYKTVATCATLGQGADELASLIKGKTTAFAGLSGVGKSSLLSLITERNLAVGEVSRIERGRHTTRHVELIAANGGYVFDTPGFSRLEIDGIRADELKLLFPEMKNLEGRCRFRGCAHIAEPDCAVIAAVERGEIAESRHRSYKELYEILKNVKDWEIKEDGERI